MLQKISFIIMPLPIFACMAPTPEFLIVGLLIFLAINALFVYLFIKSISKYKKTKRKYLLLGTLPFIYLVVSYLTLMMGGF